MSFFGIIQMAVKTFKLCNRLYGYKNVVNLFTFAATN